MSISRDIMVSTEQIRTEAEFCYAKLLDYGLINSLVLLVMEFKIAIYIKIMF